MNMNCQNLFRLLSLTGMLAAGAAAVEAAPARPNIVYILTDDLGYGDVHALNPDRCKIATPGLDRLRSEGMLFTDCHASSSICTPSRYSILTGRYDWRTRLQHGIVSPEGAPLIAPGRMTVGTFLQQQGYATAAIGKWHLGLAGNLQDFSQPITDGPRQHGFDYFYGLCASLDMPPYVFIENDHFTAIPSATKKFPSLVYGVNGGPGPARSGPAAPDFEAMDVLPQLTHKAVDYIDRRGTNSQPFFLYLALTSPHTPVVPTPEWQGKSGAGPYGDFVMETDWAVGQVLAAVDRAGLRTNTLVIFTSDNGPAPYIGVDKLEALGHYPSGPLRGYKSDIWDGGHRIPFLARWSGKIKAGSRSDQIVCLSDLLATCADILQTQLPANAGEDSVSVLPALLGTDRTPLREAVVNHSGGNGRFAIRQGDWKLELCPGSGGWGKPGDDAALKNGLPAVQLYNLRADLGEKVNLEAKHPEVVTNLVALLKKYVADGRSTPGPRQTNDVPVDIWSNKSKQRAAAE